jgi:AcrR family transcriptional regulator
MSSEFENDTRTRILNTTWKLLETRPGRRISMSEIAKASGISRQAVYLHFTSRADLLIATTHYIDEVKGLDQRLERILAADSGSEMLRCCIEVWGKYIPEIYGVSKALLASKDTDEAAAEAWTDIMGCLRDICAKIVQQLREEGKLNPDWESKQATDFIWTLISIQNWELMTQECGWSNDDYIAHVTQAVVSALTME